MKRACTVGMAVAVAGAVGMISVASAIAVLPEVRTTLGEAFPVAVSGQAGAWSWSTPLAGPVEGNKVKLSVAFSKASDEGTYAFDFEGANLEKEQCNTAGDPDNVILVSGKLNLVVALNAAKTGNQFAGAFTVPSGLEVLCGPLGKPSIKIPVSGIAIAAIEGVTEEVELTQFNLNLKCTKPASGIQQLKEYKNEAGTFEKHILSANFGLGPEAMCWEISTTMAMTSNKMIKFINIK